MMEVLRFWETQIEKTGDRDEMPFRNAPTSASGMDIK
jgi:hypothetical protein